MGRNSCGLSRLRIIIKVLSDKHVAEVYFWRACVRMCMCVYHFVWCDISKRYLCDILSCCKSFGISGVMNKCKANAAKRALFSMHDLLNVHRSHSLSISKCLYHFVFLFIHKDDFWFKFLCTYYIKLDLMQIQYISF